jgi:hypothetical protein
LARLLLGVGRCVVCDVRAGDVCSVAEDRLI